jgi:hypothetical protein
MPFQLIKHMIKFSWLNVRKNVKSHRNVNHLIIIINSKNVY